jgi:hypothetical protein
MEYTPKELERFRSVALKGLGLVAIESGVYYAWRNDQMRAHVWHLRNSVGSFCISYLHEAQDRVSQFRGIAQVYEDGSISEVKPDPTGDFDPNYLEELEKLFEEDSTHPSN